LDRRRKREKTVRKRLNIERAKRRKSISQRKSNHKTSRGPRVIPEETIFMGAQFSILNTPNLVLRDIQKISASTNKYGVRRTYKIDLSKIADIDIGAICLLLSKISELGSKNIRIWGNLPGNEDSKNLIYESGFLNHMKDLRGRQFPKKQNSKNLLVKRGFDRTSNRMLGLEIRSAVKHLTGVEAPFQPVYSIVQEMCANSIEHANNNTREKNWLFAIYYKTDRVIFTMTDIGQGVLSTLKKKTGQVLGDTLRSRDDAEVLCRAFERKYQSATQDTNRNKGLPKIKKINDEHYVDNLIVITNNVLLNFNDEEKSEVLENKFHGTFYYWELTNNCIDRWKTRKLN
jgi:hypothetical protein